MNNPAKFYLEKLLENFDLSFDESYDLMNEIMRGSINNSHLSGILIALKLKGESAEEIAGFASAMRENSQKIICDDENMIDVCGTGGDNSGSFNISTAVAFTVAGAGVKVAKHGNRSISSKSGSADVLEELGININLSQDHSTKALNEIGIAFLFAPLYHPAMKHAAPVRKELGIKTVFNMLGPLTNPAGVKKQLIGVFDNKSARIMSQSAKHLDYKKACFICCGNRFDEIYLGETTKVFEFNKTEPIKEYSISNESFKYAKTTEEDIKGSSPKVNANIIQSVFEGKEKNGAFRTITANAALALYCSEYSTDLLECTNAAEESIISGNAMNKLNELRNFC